MTTRSIRDVWNEATSRLSQKDEEVHQLKRQLDALARRLVLKSFIVGTFRNLVVIKRAAAQVTDLEVYFGPKVSVLKFSSCFADNTGYFLQNIHPRKGCSLEHL